MFLAKITQRCARQAMAAAVLATGLLVVGAEPVLAQAAQPWQHPWQNRGYGWNHRGYAWNNPGYDWRHRGYVWNQSKRGWTHRGYAWNRKGWVWNNR